MTNHKNIYSIWPARNMNIFLIAPMYNLHFSALPVSSNCYHASAQILCKYSMSRPIVAVSASLLEKILPRCASHMHSHGLPGNLFISPVCHVHVISVITFSMALSRPGMKLPFVWSPFIFLWNGMSSHSLHPITGRMDREWIGKYIQRKKG